MHTIILMNSKGGCGKTTLATNIAAWYADEGARVCLADYDPQRSSLDWLLARGDYQGIPEIRAIDAVNHPLRPPKGTDILVIDAPAGTHGGEIGKLLKRVDTLLMPVLPSLIDMRACSHFLKELMASGRAARGQIRTGIIANRVRENTRVFQQLDQYLGDLKIPILTHLRESQNYIRSAETGLGIFELAPSLVWQDVSQWDRVFDWLAQQQD